MSLEKYLALFTLDRVKALILLITALSGLGVWQAWGNYSKSEDIENMKAQITELAPLVSHNAQPVVQRVIHKVDNSYCDKLMSEHVKRAH